MSEAPAIEPPDSSGRGSDRDGDGFTNRQDCAPDDPSVRPGATDKPDLGFVDRNCDGIDGDKSRAVFVAPAPNGGNDASSGAFGQPKATLMNAIGVAQAATPAKDVYVAVGVYPGAVSLVDGVGIYGAYSPAGWLRSLSGKSSVEATGTAASAHTVNVVLQLMTFSGATPAAGSTYGPRAVNSTLTLRRVTLTAGSAVSGADGTTHGVRAPGGQDGARGAPGVEYSGGLGCYFRDFVHGGAAGHDAVRSPHGGVGGAARQAIPTSLTSRATAGPAAAAPEAPRSAP